MTYPFPFSRHCESKHRQYVSQVFLKIEKPKREYKLISTLKYKSTNEAAAIMSLIPSSLTLAFARKRF